MEVPHTYKIMYYLPDITPKYAGFGRRWKEEHQVRILGHVGTVYVLRPSANKATVLLPLVSLFVLVTLFSSATSPCHLNTYL
jgi:hypothetical protein